MSTSGTQNLPDSFAAEPLVVPLGARIDAPHTPAAGASPPDEKVSGNDSSVALEQIETQAAQLAEILRARQQELDHREAQVNARDAQLDSEERAARLWLSQRLAELEERGHLPVADLAARQEALQQATADVEHQKRLLGQQRERLDQERDALVQLQQRSSERRQAEEERLRRQRQELADHRRQILTELDRKRRGVARRGEQTDRCRAALEQLRGELVRLHRETLEIRLATEELWAQLSGAAPPPALTRSLGQIRNKLAEHYRLAHAELQAERLELEEIRRQLSDGQRELARHKQQFDKWVAGCRQEAEQQAERLIARERVLSCKTVGGVGEKSPSPSGRGPG
ncbi:MAG: hypothetical protein ABSG68_05360 [Thermoguttaceae bacterium]|jgi:chromosome segregation ATPase